ncbi:MAG: hypothetical protein KUA33_04900, partial [Methanobacterium sp.]|nr:hypothetical protein [Methanobacterium sp.]
AMDSIELFIGEMDFDDFKEDDKTSSAVIRKPSKTSLSRAENLQFSSILRLSEKPLKTYQKTLKKIILTFPREQWPECVINLFIFTLESNMS